MPSGRVCRSLARHTGLVQTVSTLFGVVAGIGLGLLLKSVRDGEPWSQREVLYIKFAGDMHIRFIQALIIPIIVSSMISAVGSLDVGLSRGLCVKTLVYYMGTTTFAAAFGTLVVVWMRPGVMNTSSDGGRETTISGCGIQNSTASNVDSVLDIVRNVFPPNLVGAAVESNLLGIIFLALVYGLTLSSMGTAGKPMLDFFTALMAATMRIMECIIWFFPVTTCLLLAGQLVQEAAIGAVFQTLGWYTVAHIVSYVVHSFVFLPLIYWIVVRKNVFPFVRNLSPAIATAFGTNSSSATLPVTMECVQGANGIDERIARFVLPIGATVNMDGSAIYRVIVINYLAQLCGKAMPFTELLNVALFAIFTSIGTAGLPSGGMGVLALLVAFGYPVEHFALILPVEWLVDRFSTITNVMGDAIGAAIILNLSKGELERTGPHDNLSKCNGVARSHDHFILETVPVAAHNTTVLIEKSQSNLTEDNMGKAQLH